MSNKGTKSHPMGTDLDDWDTDPDSVRDMDEVNQRWGGTHRTVGSINMNDLIDQVTKEHQKMREKFNHSSQRDHSEGFGGKFGVQRDRMDPSAHNYDYQEKLSKHTSQEISRKVITSSLSSFSNGNDEISEARRRFLERVEGQSQKPPPPPKSGDFFTGEKVKSATNLRTTGSPKATDLKEEFSTNRKRFVEEQRSSSSTREPSDLAFRSIQDKINAFKKDFDDIKNDVGKKYDLSNVIKKTTNVEKSKNTTYVSRYDTGDDASKTSTPSPRPAASSYSPKDFPKTSIKSLSKKFETLCREDSEDFRRKTEEKRKEYFDQIKSQVLETRKELDGFDPIDEDIADKMSYRRTTTSPINKSTTTQKFASSKPSSNLSRESPDFGRPKVYTRRETTQEEIVSKVVKENDKIIENETKRNVEQSSSCHGSSDEETNEPTSIKFLDRELRNSSQARVESPIDELKRKIPVVNPELKGAGLMARTLYDYQASEGDELSFEVDDLITNIDKVDTNWYFGTITKDGRKRTGLFPANHVKLLNDDGEF